MSSERVNAATAGVVPEAVRAFVAANPHLAFVPFLEQDGGGIKAKGGACAVVRCALTGHEVKILPKKGDGAKDVATLRARMAHSFELYSSFSSGSGPSRCP